MKSTELKEFKFKLDKFKEQGFNTLAVTRINGEDIFKFETEEEIKQVEKLGYKAYLKDEFENQVTEFVKTNNLEDIKGFSVHYLGNGYEK